MNVLQTGKSTLLHMMGRLDTPTSGSVIVLLKRISFMNMFLVDFQNRKCEFGLFEAVGTTKKQLNRMLDREIGIYLGGSLVISLLCGSIFSVIVCKRLDIINHCITWLIPCKKSNTAI